MRVLAACTGGAGHYGPMVPFLRGCVAAGHDLLLAAPEVMRTDEFAFAPLPDTPPEILKPIFAMLPSLPPEEAATMVLGRVFGGANVDATLSTWESLVADWRPDVVVREIAELGSYVAASRAGVPQVQVAIGLRSTEERVVAANGDEFEQRHGVPIAPVLATRTVSLVPPSLEPADPARERYSDPAMVDRDAPLPAAVPEGDEPLVYVTFGSIAANLPPFRGVYAAALAALADLPVRVLLTTGAGGDPAGIAAPPNARVERWVPQAAVLRHTAVAVGHGGFGTTFGALAAGVPVAVLPLFADDQFANADAVAAAGAGLRVADADGLRDAVTTLLGDGPQRARARDVAAEMASLPDARTWAVA